MYFLKEWWLNWPKKLGKAYKPKRCSTKPSLPIILLFIIVHSAIKKKSAIIRSLPILIWLSFDLSDVLFGRNDEWWSECGVQSFFIKGFFLACEVYSFFLRSASWKITEHGQNPITRLTHQTSEDKHTRMFGNYQTAGPSARRPPGKIVETFLGGGSFFCKTILSEFPSSSLTNPSLKITIASLRPYVRVKYSESTQPWRKGNALVTTPIAVKRSNNWHHRMISKLKCRSDNTLKQNLIRAQSENYNIHRNNRLCKERGKTAKTYGSRSEMLSTNHLTQLV